MIEEEKVLLEVDGTFSFAKGALMLSATTAEEGGCLYLGKCITFAILVPNPFYAGL